MEQSEKTLDMIVNLCKNRGYVFPGSEIYGGLANSWDYGPLGVEFKNNVKKAWLKKFVQESPYNVGLDAAIIMNPQTWVTTGHVSSFSDPLLDCRACKARHRADKLIGDEHPEVNVDAMSFDEMDAMMEELGVIQDTLTMHDFYIIDTKVEEVARALGLLELGLSHDVTDLSGGQRMKVLLAKLLLEKPDILLLDEPTNYLDAEHIAWLKRYLQEYENAFILISHDIPFLNDVVNIIYHMENQRLDRYVGDYDKFQEVYEVKKSQLEAAYRKQQQEISELKDFVARNKARVATRNMAMSRQKKLDKMDVIELAAERPKPEFNFKLGRTPGRYIFETKDLVIGYDEPLSKPLNISMERGHKIALVGANGIGKTTLLKSILGLIPSLGGSVELGENLEIGYFEQEIKGENRNTCIDEIWEEFPSFSQYEVRSALAKCGLTTKHIESLVRVLSGGEQAKVRLCKLINKSTNVLLLDEPTNHLDVDAKDELKRALQEYRGSILLICHEPEFYQDIVNEVWDCSKWTTKIL